MPVVLSDDVAASLLAAITATDATALSPLFGDLQNLLLASTRPLSAPLATPQQPGGLRLSPLLSSITAIPQQSNQTSLRHEGPLVTERRLNSRYRASSVPLGTRPLWDGLSENSDFLETHRALTGIYSSPDANRVNPESNASSPTVVGSPSDLDPFLGTDKSMSRSMVEHIHILSPLRLGTPADPDEDMEEDDDIDAFFDFSARPPTPTPRLQPSRKRIATDYDTEDDEEVVQQDHRGNIGGHGGGDNGDGAGPPPANHNWTPDCVRRGDRERSGLAANHIGAMPCDDAQQSGSASRCTNNSQRGSRKMARIERNEVWTVDDQGAPITVRAGQLLSQLLGIYTIGARDALDNILTGPSDSSTPINMGSADLHVIVANIKVQTNSRKQASLLYMLSLVQLALNIDCLQQDRAKKHFTKLTLETLANTYARDTRPNTFRNWVSWGKHLLILCAAGTMYILPVLAALDMRSKITAESATAMDIVSMANALRAVKQGHWLSVVRRLMIPLKYLQSQTGYLQSLQVTYNVPVQVGEEPQMRSLGFSDIKELDSYLPALKPISTNFLPVHLNGTCLAASPGQESLIPEKSSCPKYKTPSPVTKANRDEFTETQRTYASEAPVAISIEDLEDKINAHCTGGEVKPNKYIEINSSILKRPSGPEALYITDVDGNFLALLFTVPNEYREMLVRAVERIQALMPEEFKDENSRNKFFKYFSVHYVWYARFGEKGDGAPSEAHPDNIRKGHGGKVNFEQHLPRQSKECLENSEEYAQLADAFEDFFDLIRVAVS
ncbi:hypothetical protein B0H13DRAFT_1921117 [Mycena leptocephala]|nr:hypothetical protein B0H13DRAFT_1921117 [Mycena leptocephala]